MDQWETIYRKPKEEEEWERIAVVGQEPEKKELSGLDWWVSQGARTLPAVAGSIAGGATGFFGAGLGAIPGAMAGGAIGSAIGSGLGQGYEQWRGYRDEFNPYELGVETALGAIPPIFGPTKPVASAGLREIAKYAGKSALSGATEGAIIGGAATPFQNWAQTGEFGATPEQIAQGAGGGALFGGATGGTLGTYFGRQQARGLQAIGNAPPPTDSVDLTPPPPPPPPQGPGLTEEFNRRIPLGDVTGRSLPFPTPSPLETEFNRPIPLQKPRGPLFGEVEEPIIPPPPSDGGGGGEIVKDWPADPMEVDRMKQQGFVPYGINPVTHVAQGILRPKTPAPAAAPLTPDRTEASFQPGERIPFPKNQLTQAKLDTLREQGYESVGEDGQGNVLFELVADYEPQELRRPPNYPGEGEGIAQFPSRARFDELIAKSNAEGLSQNERIELTTLRKQNPNYVLPDLPPGQERIPPSPENKFGPPDSTRSQQFLGYFKERLEREAKNRPALTSRQTRRPGQNFEVFNTNTDRTYTWHGTMEEAQAKVDKLYQNNSPEFDVREHPPENRPGPRLVPEIEEPAEMRVPGHKEGKGGLENVAVGGADPRVLDVLGSSLYSRPRPITTIKELLQNAWDEHKEIGSKESVRILLDSGAKDPRGGPDGKSITVRDRGRGLPPEQIYTVLTDLGKTGKAGVESAAGGFGFAKAAPFLGGKFVRVRSIVDVPAKMGRSKRMLYSFEGNPAELKNQARGVPLNASAVSDDIPTGLEVMVFYGDDIPGYYGVQEWAQNMAERSPSVESGTLIAKDFGGSYADARKWLDETPQNPISEYNYPKSTQSEYHPQPMPTLMDTITTPGANVNIHYDIEPGVEATGAKLHMTNKGMYQGSDTIGYGGEAVANVPRSIVADIVATVEEGHTEYPFSANREQINSSVERAIDKWVRENIVSGVTQKRIAAIQAKYDGIAQFGSNNMHYLDEGDLLTPDELNQLSSHPKMRNGLEVLRSIHSKMVEIADTLGWTPQDFSATWTKPSQRLKKFGLLFKAPDSKGTVMGIHIPRPDDLNDSAILFNLMEHLNEAAKHDTPIDKLAAEIVVTLAHEDAHIPGGAHDKGHSYRDADLRTAFGAKNTVNWLAELEGAFGDGTGKLSPEISDLLRIYNGSRTRATGGPDALLATGISRTGQPNTGRGAGGNAQGIGAGQVKPGTVKKGPSILKEAYDFSRGVTTILDLSASLRQGLPLVFTKEWRTAWGKQIQALGSEKAYQKMLADIKARPMFQSRIDFKTGKIQKSFAERAGIKLMDVDGPGPREEAFAGKWIGKIPGARPSNRAYTGFLNQLRADTFESLIKDAAGAFKAGMKGARDPHTDMLFAKEIADFVNTATGRGPLKFARPTIEGGRVKLKESSFEQHAGLLANTLFSPKLFAAHMRMLNPATYAMASPFVRKQYLKAALSVAGAWGTASGLAYMAGADVSLDPNSADFGKIRIGNTRLDPAGGYQQYLVALSRLISGHYTSSGTGEQTELGAGYRAETRKDVAERFMTNKLHPMLKFGYDLLFASQYQPFHVEDRTAQLFVPLIIQDVVELAKEDPALLPLLGPVALGMGTQTYGKGESRGRFIPPESDILFEGGPISNLWEEESPRPTY